MARTKKSLMASPSNSLNSTTVTAPGYYLTKDGTVYQIKNDSRRGDPDSFRKYCGDYFSGTFSKDPSIDDGHVIYPMMNPDEHTEEISSYKAASRPLYAAGVESLNFRIKSTIHIEYVWLMPSIDSYSLQIFNEETGIDIAYELYDEATGEKIDEGVVGTMPVDILYGDGNPIQFDTDYVLILSAAGFFSYTYPFHSLKRQRLISYKANQPDTIDVNKFQVALNSPYQRPIGVGDTGVGDTGVIMSGVPAAVPWWINGGDAIKLVENTEIYISEQSIPDFAAATP